MLFSALITSVLVLAVAAAAIIQGGAWVTAFVVLALLFALVLPLMLFAWTPTFLLSFMLFFPVLCRRMLMNWRQRALALGLPCLIAIVATAWFVWQDQQQLAKLRVSYPYVSMEGRLPLITALKTHPPLGDHSLERISGIELALNERPREAPWEERRERMLEGLHENTVGLFVNSTGFGSTRMTEMWRPNERYLEGWPRPPVKPISQPRTQALSAAAEGESWQPQVAESSQDQLHRAGTIDFIYPAGFGYVKDRRHVAGFKSHRFTEVPTVKNKWSIATVELVGLLLHPTPVVYISPHLPNMEELRGVPTRALDRFEAAGLEAIQRGEDLFVGQTPSGTRMVGTIRSAKQCLQCHEGNRGDLLGAFSYRLEANGK